MELGVRHYILYISLVDILRFVNELTCFETIIFHCFNMDQVLCVGLFCCQAFHNAPHGLNYELVYCELWNDCILSAIHHRVIQTLQW